MTTTLITGIGELALPSPSFLSTGAGASTGAGSDGSRFTGTRPTVELRRDAAIVVEDGLVAWVGDASSAPAADERVDVEGRAVIPGFVDSHSHLLFAGDRADEFEARMAGRRYEAGGIRRTVSATRQATDEQLRTGVQHHVRQMHAQGTTTVEIKSGYGLTVDDERRSLAIAREFTDETTYLGAHVVPAEYTDRRDDYVTLVAGEMLERAAPHARWIDVFIEDGAFTVDEARHILTAGIRKGLGARVHAGQLGLSDGVRLAVELGAASVDHCTFLSDADIEALAASADEGASTSEAATTGEGTGSNAPTVATLLPGAEFSTRQPYPNARRLIDAGVTVALASDCNPGSSYTSSLAFCMAVAVRDMGMTPAEALWASTAGGAAALRRTDVGHLSVGARADLVVLDAPSFLHLAYRPGVPLVSRVIGGAKLVAN